MSEHRFDPFEPKQTQNMWELMRELRRDDPVCRPADGFVYVEAEEEDGREPVCFLPKERAFGVPALSCPLRRASLAKSIRLSMQT